MPGENVTIGICDSPGEAYSALRRLQKSGFDVRKLSIAVREQRGAGQVISYYWSGDHMRHWGEQGALWTAVWSLLCGWGLFVFPGSGSVIVAGPLTEWIIAGLENASILGRFSGIAAGLYSIGIDPDSIPEYEAALNAGKCLVLAHGTRAEVSRASATLQWNRSGPSGTGGRSRTAEVVAPPPPQAQMTKPTAAPALASQVQNEYLDLDEFNIRPDVQQALTQNASSLECPKYV